jgi:hypothetical protein
MVFSSDVPEKRPRYFSNTRKVYSFIFVICVGTIGYILVLQYAITIICGLLSGEGLTTLGGYPIGHDFLAFWTATKLAVTGDPSSIYNLQILKSAERAVSGTDSAYFAWNYPPTFLVILLPLSMIPYLAAYGAWILGTVSGYGYIAYRIFPRPFTPWLFVAFPNAIWNLIAGQNGFLSAMILGSGIVILDHRPFAGGFVLGLLSYKPHLTMMIPLALIAGRYWRALCGFATGAACLILISMAVFGTSVWSAFIQNIPFALTHWQSAHFWPKMASIYSLMRFTGLNAWGASFVQLCFTIAAAAVTCRVWYRGERPAVKGSVLAICTALASPYLFHGDLVIIGLAFAWLGKMEYERAEGSGLPLLMILWIGLFFTTDSLLIQNFNFSSIICILLLGFTLARCDSRYSFMHNIEKCHNGPTIASTSLNDSGKAS